MASKPDLEDAASYLALTLDDLKVVIKYLYPVRAKWRFLALELDLLIGDIEAIEQKHSDPSDQLLEVLKKWLGKGTASWKVIVAALRSPPVDNHSVAKIIESAFTLTLYDENPTLKHGNQPQLPYVGILCRDISGTGSASTSVGPSTNVPNRSTSLPVKHNEPDPTQLIVEKEMIGRIEKPRPTRVTHSDIDLEWKRPSFGGHAVQFYSILYYPRGDLDGTHLERRTGGAEEHATIDSLSADTDYVFRIQATFAPEMKLESELTETIRTRSYLAETVHRMSRLVTKKTSKTPAIYELTKSLKTIDDEMGVRQYEIEQSKSNQAEKAKVLMLLGTKGAGKKTLINGIANYMYGVQWEDDFRFVLVPPNEPALKSQVHGQTSWITTYALHRGEASPIPYSLTIIDMPSFGDAEEIEQRKRIALQIKRFICAHPHLKIDGIGFVTQAFLTQLSQSQKHMMDSIFSIYGRDLATNIFVMATFADGQDPPVMKSITEAKIPHQACFKFNNSALFAGKDGSFDAMFWKMGMKSFADFFSDFGRAEHRSLQLTRKVLSEREQLENVLKELQPQIHAGLTKMDELQRVVTLLKHNKFLIEQNREFIIRVPITKQQKVDTPPGHYTTNCLNCNYTCHDNCAYADNADKRRCCAMDGRGNCTVCPGNCVWSKHVNNPYIFKFYTEEEGRTFSELKNRYDTAKKGESRAETMIGNIKDELNTLETIVLEQMDKAKNSLIRLDEIALKPNPLSEVDYIDQLIKSEEQQGKPGWQERVGAYKALRKRAELLRKIKDHK